MPPNPLVGRYFFFTRFFFHDFLRFVYWTWLIWECYQATGASIHVDFLISVFTWFHRHFHTEHIDIPSWYARLDALDPARSSIDKLFKMNENNFVVTRFSVGDTLKYIIDLERESTFKRVPTPTDPRSSRVPTPTDPRTSRVPTPYNLRASRVSTPILLVLSPQDTSSSSLEDSSKTSIDRESTPPMKHPTTTTVWHWGCVDDDRSFIVLAETKFSFRCIPVWDQYSPHRTRVEKKHMW